VHVKDSEVDRHEARICGYAGRLIRNKDDCGGGGAGLIAMLVDEFGERW
jgi:hypothetical protein